MTQINWINLKNFKPLAIYYEQTDNKGNQQSNDLYTGSRVQLTSCLQYIVGDKSSQYSVQIGITAQAKFPSPDQHLMPR